MGDGCPGGFDGCTVDHERRFGQKLRAPRRTTSAAASALLRPSPASAMMPAITAARAMASLLCWETISACAQGSCKRGQIAR